MLAQAVPTTEVTVRLLDGGGTSALDWMVAALPSVAALAVVALGALFTGRQSVRQWERQRELDVERRASERELEWRKWERHETRVLYADFLRALDRAVRSIDSALQKHVRDPTGVLDDEMSKIHADVTQVDQLRYEVQVIGSDEVVAAVAAAHGDVLKRRTALVTARTTRKPEDAQSLAGQDQWNHYFDVLDVVRRELRQP